MIVDPTDSTVAADAVPAGVQAGEAQPIAILVLRAIIILQTVDVSTSSFVRIAGEEPWRAGAFAHVVSGDTDGSRSALEGEASLDASLSSVRHSAHFVFLTLDVAGASVN